MKKVFFTILIIAISIGYATDCDSVFIVEKIIGNKYRQQVDIVPGSIGFNGSTSQRVLNPDTEEDWFDVAFSKGIWVGGFDPAGNLKMAGSAYPRDGDIDFVKGPVRTDTTVHDELCEYYDKAWKVNGYQVVDLRRAFESGNLSLGNIPSEILTWPAKGNPHIGVAAPDYEMAPFYDHDGDDSYDPLQGDYPIALVENPAFIPSQMTFSVFNDYIQHSATFSTPIKMEFHQLDYVVSCDDPIESEKSIFTRLTYINKGFESLIDFKLGIWNDTDLGNLENDYAGCSRELNASYVYNRDGLDMENQSSLEVPEDIGAVSSLVLLNGDIKSFIYYNRSGLANPNPATVDPLTGEQYFSYLCGRWLDGTPITTSGTGYNPGSTETTLFAYPDFPTDPDGWSMQTAISPVGDIRYITTMVAEDEILPGASNTVDFVDHVHIDRENLGLSVFNTYETAINNLKSEFAQMLNGEFDCGGLSVSCENDCVWPGDVDDDGTVQGKDIVLLGNLAAADLTDGLARHDRSSEWFGWASQDWSESFIGINGKYADATGNGRINLKDIEAASDNFGKQRSNAQGGVVLEESGGVMELSTTFPFSEIDLENLDPIPFLATRFEVEIILGESSEVLDEPIHGLSFQIKYDTSLLSLQERQGLTTPEFDFSRHHYAGMDYDRDLDELTGDNKLSFMMTNIDGEELATGRPIASFSARVRQFGKTSNLDRKDTLVLRFENVFATNAEGETIALAESHDTLFLENLIYNSSLVSSSSDVSSDITFNLSPNPTHGQLHLDFGQKQIGQVGIYSTDGQLYMQQKLQDESSLILDTSDLMAGIYICRFVHGNGMVSSQKFIKME